MAIVSKTVEMSDRQLRTKVTKEMISDIKNMDFYVSKKLVYPINNKIITIKECSYKNHYKVTINYVYLERLMKLNKLMDKNNYKEIENLVSICEENKRGWWGVTEDDMVEEITQDINKGILSDLIKLGIQNGKSNI